RERYHDLPLGYVGHSFGGQVLGLLANNSEVSRALLVAAQAGYWRLMTSPERYRVYAVLNFVGMPPRAGLCARLERTWRGFAQGRVSAWEGLGQQPDFPLRRRIARRGYLRQIQRRAARVLPVRRSLGNTAGCRTALQGLCCDDARGHPRDARRCRREQARTFR